MIEKPNGTTGRFLENRIEPNTAVFQKSTSIEPRQQKPFPHTPSLFNAILH